MSDHGSQPSDGGHHGPYEHSHDRHDSYYDDHTVKDDDYWDDGRSRNESRSQSQPARPRHDTLRKVALAVGLAGVVVGATYLWNRREESQREQREYERRMRRRQRREFTRAKEARRRKEEEEEAAEEDSLDEDAGRAQEPRRITYFPGDRSQSRSSRAREQYRSVGDRPRRWSDGEGGRDSSYRDRDREREHDDDRRTRHG